MGVVLLLLITTKTVKPFFVFVSVFRKTEIKINITRKILKVALASKWISWSKVITKSKISKK